MVRHSSVVAMLMAIVSPFIWSSSARAGAADEAKLKALENNFAAAIRAKDVGAVMKSYVSDDSLIVFDVTPPRQYVGAKAYAKDWTDLFAMYKGPINFEISDLSISADDEIAYSHSIQHMSGTTTKDEPVDFTVRVTDVYRKVKGTWLIAHEHVSVPVDLATAKADLSSKP
jgi:ketosteroid isomerase-like protein